MQCNSCIIQLPITSPHHHPTPTMDMPTLPKPGPFLDPFLNACICYPFPSFYTEAKQVCYIYRALFDTPNIMPMQCSLMVSSQPPPFPFLYIGSSSNTATVLHGIMVFHPPLGSSIATHPLASAILALAGEILDQGAPLKLLLYLLKLLMTNWVASKLHP